MEPFVGQIQAFGFDFPPRGWATCSGQLISIQQNSALFSLLGTTYGGNGVQNFALPDLQGRVAISQGKGSTGSTYSMGEAAGTETATLLISNLPSHTHPLMANNTGGAATAGSPTSNFMGAPVDPVTGTALTIYAPTQNTVMNPGAVGPIGANVPIGLLQPFLCINYSIAMVGAFPSRN